MKSVKAIIQHSGRLLTVLMLLVLTFCFAMFQGGFVSWFVFFTILPFLVYAILLGIVPLKIEEISRTIKPTKVERGDQVTITVTFRNRSWFPLLYVTVSEMPMDARFYEAANGHSSKLFFVGWKRAFNWTYELKNLQRGEHYFQGLTFVFTDFFGWTLRKMDIRQPKMFTVYPKITEMKSTSLRMQYDQGTITSLYSIVKDTSMATGVREYQPGDRFSWIHWKSFAKSGELRTKEFEDKQSQNIFMLLDRSVQAQFEQVVDFTASVMQTIVKERGDVSFLSVGTNHFFYPTIRTASQLEKVMQHLAVVQADAIHSIEALLKSEQNRINQSILILVTSELTPDMLQLLMTGSKYSRAIVCFVIGQEKVHHLQDGNNKLIYVPEGKFEHAFAEVSKP